MAVGMGGTGSGPRASPTAAATAAMAAAAAAAAAANGCSGGSSTCTGSGSQSGSGSGSGSGGSVLPGVAISDPALKQHSEATYFQRLQEERGMRKELQTSLLTERRERKAAEHAADQARSEAAHATAALAAFEAQYAAALETERAAARAKLDAEVLSLREAHRRHVDEFESRARRLAEGAAAEDRRRLEEAIAERLAARHADAAAAEREAHARALAERDARLERLGTQCAELVTRNSDLTNQLHHANGQRRKLIDKLQEAIEHGVALRRYQCVLKHVLVACWLRIRRMHVFMLRLHKKLWLHAAEAQAAEERAAAADSATQRGRIGALEQNEAPLWLRRGKTWMRILEGTPPPNPAANFTNIALAVPPPSLQQHQQQPSSPVATAAHQAQALPGGHSSHESIFRDPRVLEEGSSGDENDEEDDADAGGEGGAEGADGGAGGKGAWGSAGEATAGAGAGASRNRVEAEAGNKAAKESSGGTDSTSSSAQSTPKQHRRKVEAKPATKPAATAAAAGATSPSVGAAPSLGVSSPTLGAVAAPPSSTGPGAAAVPAAAVSPPPGAPPSSSVESLLLAGLHPASTPAMFPVVEAAAALARSASAASSAAATAAGPGSGSGSRTRRTTGVFVAGESGTYKFSSGANADLSPTSSALGTGRRRGSNASMHSTGLAGLGARPPPPPPPHSHSQSARRPSTFGLSFYPTDAFAAAAALTAARQWRMDPASTRSAYDPAGAGPIDHPLWFGRGPARPPRKWLPRLHEAELMAHLADLPPLLHALGRTAREREQYYKQNLGGFFTRSNEMSAELAAAHDERAQLAAALKTLRGRLARGDGGDAQTPGGKAREEKSATGTGTGGGAASQSGSKAAGESAAALLVRLRAQETSLTSLRSALAVETHRAALLAERCEALQAASLLHSSGRLAHSGRDLAAGWNWQWGAPAQHGQEGSGSANALAARMSPRDRKEWIEHEERRRNEKAERKRAAAAAAAGQGSAAEGDSAGEEKSGVTFPSIHGPRPSVAGSPRPGPSQSPSTASLSAAPVPPLTKSPYRSGGGGGGSKARHVSPRKDERGDSSSSSNKRYTLPSGAAASASASASALPSASVSAADLHATSGCNGPARAFPAPLQAANASATAASKHVLHRTPSKDAAAATASDQRHAPPDSDGSDRDALPPPSMAQRAQLVPTISGIVETAAADISATSSHLPTAAACSPAESSKSPADAAPSQASAGR